MWDRERKRSLEIKQEARASLFKPPPPGTKTNWAMLTMPPKSLSPSKEEANISQALKWKNQRHCKNLMRRAVHCSPLSVWHNTSWHVVIFSLSVVFIHCLYFHCLHWMNRVDIQAQAHSVLSVRMQEYHAYPQHWLIHTFSNLYAP